VPEKSRPVPVYKKPWPGAASNFSVPLRAVPMEDAEPISGGSSTTSDVKGRPALIVLTSEANIISLQKELRSIVNGEFFLQSTATRT
jgi:hypothetical protein